MTSAFIRVCQVPFDQLKTWINGEAKPSALNTLAFCNNCLISAVGAITVSWVTRKISCVHRWKVRKVKMRSIKPAKKNRCNSKFQWLNHNTSVEILQSTVINPCTTCYCDMCFHNVTGFSRGQREHREMEDKLEELVFIIFKRTNEIPHRPLEVWLPGEFRERDCCPVLTKTANIAATIVYWASQQCSS